MSIVHSELLQIVEDGKEGDSETTLDSVGFPLRSIPTFLLQHVARRLDMACDDLHSKGTTIGLPESHRNRKRSRSTSTFQLDLQTALPKDLPKDLPYDVRPLHTTTSNVPIATGPDTVVMVHCLSYSESASVDISYLVLIHRRELAL